MGVENRDYSMDFQGKTVLVTGGASGIGEAIARLFTELGATVCVVDLNGSGAAAPEHYLVQGDVSSEADVQRVAAEAFNRMGSIDVLVNNAGMLGPREATASQELAAWQRAIDVNLTGTYLMSRAVGPRMVERGGGAIINIASILGLGGSPRIHAYGASKAGVIMLTRALACEWARAGVRVNCVAPGYTLTRGIDRLAGAGKFDPAPIETRTPMGRMGKPIEIAHAVAYLASDWASYVTGATLAVDGGWTAFGAAGEAARN
ncbi:SDR family NAD(P)-dependent oxidoreductase [Cupriavidus sp. SK-4]|uniref:SDR family NAD(P)-dependent oxidoreductase n=1 Tax=Cupriavidus sp. SK-4 TaxID=574750 RepID=UPI000A4C86C6|nr:SDR family NAD(P)-dependent oxidoreductase [Cupriavidus sp. SK-4]